MVEKETKLWVKFYVLTIFSLISLTQCLNWFTFSSVDPDKVGCGPQCQDGVDPPGYYGRHMTTGVVAWLLNWGSVFGMAFFPVQGLLVNRSHGLRNCVLLGGFLNLLGCVLRLVPSYLSVDGRHATLSFLWLHAGQICVSCAGPLFMGTVSHLSCLWFFENERATATAVASTANWFGSTVGFLLGPALVPTAASFVVLLQAELVMAAVPFFCALIYFPSFPSDPPSRAGAKLAISQGHMDAGQCALLQNPRELSDLGLPDEDNLSFQAGLRLALGNTSFLWCVLMAGTLSGVFSTYQGLLEATHELSFFECRIEVCRMFCFQVSCKLS